MLHKADKPYSVINLSYPNILACKNWPGVYPSSMRSNSKKFVQVSPLKVRSLA